MKAKEFLNQAKKLDSMIKNKLIEKEMWYQIAQSTTAKADVDRVQSSGSKEKMADSVIKYVDIDDEIDACIKMLVDAKMDIIYTIEQLDHVEYELLHLVYIQDKTLYEAADCLGNSYSWATTVHGRALKSIQNLLNEREM